MHGYTSALRQFLFIFRCHSRPSWQRHKALISQYLSPVSKNTEVWWSDENDLIHALDTWGSALTHKHTLRAHTLELSSTSHFILISAEGPAPEWVGPVVSVCQNRWTLDPLSAFPAKQMTWLLLLQPSFRLYIFCHLWASSHLFVALPHRHKQIKTVSVGMDSYFSLDTIFAFLTSPTWRKGNYSRATTRLFLVSVSLSSCVSAPINSLIWVGLLVSQCEQSLPWPPLQVQPPRGVWEPIFSPWALTLQATVHPHQETITKTTLLGSTK